MSKELTACRKVGRMYRREDVKSSGPAAKKPPIAGGLTGPRCRCRPAGARVRYPSLRPPGAAGKQEMARLSSKNQAALKAK
jgi:hypothetical protein